MRGLDRSTTPLGAVEQWPQSRIAADHSASVATVALGPGADVQELGTLLEVLLGRDAK